MFKIIGSNASTRYVRFLGVGNSVLNILDFALLIILVAEILTLDARPWTHMTSSDFEF